MLVVVVSGTVVVVSGTVVVVSGTVVVVSGTVVVVSGTVVVVWKQPSRDRDGVGLRGGQARFSSNRPPAR